MAMTKAMLPSLTSRVAAVTGSNCDAGGRATATTTATASAIATVTTATALAPAKTPAL